MGLPCRVDSSIVTARRQEVTGMHKGNKNPPRNEAFICSEASTPRCHSKEKELGLATQ